MTRTTILAEIHAERERQDARWGGIDCDPFVYLAVLVEEVGEVARAMHDARFGGDPSVFEPMLHEELVQVAAVAVQMMERLAAGRMPWGGELEVRR